MTSKKIKDMMKEMGASPKNLGQVITDRRRAAWSTKPYKEVKLSDMVREALDKERMTGTRDQWARPERHPTHPEYDAKQEDDTKGDDKPEAQEEGSFNTGELPHGASKNKPKEAKYDKKIKLAGLVPLEALRDDSSEEAKEIDNEKEFGEDRFSGKVDDSEKQGLPLDNYKFESADPPSDKKKDDPFAQAHKDIEKKWDKWQKTGSTKEAGHIRLRDMMEDDGGAGEEAKKRGLVHKGWGRYADPKTGEIVAKSADGKLTDIEPGSDGHDSPSPQSKADFVRQAYAKRGSYKSPAIDPNEYPEKKGLEGPFRQPSGHVLYYDPREGSYYDSKSDMYVSQDDYEAMQRRSRDQ